MGGYWFIFAAVTTTSNIQKILAELPFLIQRKTCQKARGSHYHFKHPENPGRVTVPHPKKDLPKGTLRGIFRQAGWQWPPR
jgi:predicted RNA binding protein YcfA (HicA-like mRNA interferase family)